MKRYTLLFASLVVARLLFAQADAGPDKVDCFKTGVVIGGEGDPAWCYSWSPTTGLSDPKVQHPSAKPATTTTYTLTVTDQNFKQTTDEVKVMVLQSISINFDQTVCDGEEVAMRLTPLPEDIPQADFLACLKGANVSFASKPLSQSYGNPAGTTTLAFERLDEYGEVNIKVAIWYATQPDFCNNLSSYEISVTAELGGKTVTGKETLTVDATPSEGIFACLNAYVTIEPKRFSGSPTVRVTPLSDKTYQGILVQGSFKRNVRGVMTNNVPQNSQFFAMIQAEEEHHMGQLDGTKSTILNDLWLAENVINKANAKGPFKGATEQEVIRNAKEAYKQALNSEMARSETEYKARHCAIEREAKTVVKSSFRAVLDCTYPECR